MKTTSKHIFLRAAFYDIARGAANDPDCKLAKICRQITREARESIAAQNRTKKDLNPNENNITG